MKRCYLVRHAQTIWNSENRLQGLSDVPLSALGLQQAERLGAFFASRRVQGIFTSGLQRTQQTAQAIATGNGHRISPLVERELAEMHFGVWEGLTPEEIDGRFAGAYQRWRACPSAVYIPQAEPIEAFRARVRRVMQTIRTHLGEGEYVIVSHGGVIAAMLADVLQADYDLLVRFLRLDNAGITALEWGADASHVLWVNSTTHLEALPH